MADGMGAKDAHAQFEQCISLEELHERRRLFIQAMRHPEMRMIRLALDVLKCDEYLDWRTIEHLDVSPWYQSGCWGVEISQFFVYHFLPTRDTASVTRDDLSVIDLHWDDLPEGASCGCFLCEKARNEQAAA